MPVFNWLQIGLGAVGAFGLSYLLHTVDVDRIEAKGRADLVYQQGALEKKCADDKAITKEANDGLVKSRDAIAAKLATALSLHPSRCILPASGKAKLSSIQPGHVSANGFSTDWLRTYAATCETIRQSYIVCTDSWQ